MMNQAEIDSASFRDPSGSVFTHNGRIFRSIFEEGQINYELARDAGIYDKLFEADLLLPHTEIGVEDFCPTGTVYCLSYAKLPLVSYPWEWPYSMLKDNALLHLKMMEALVPLGFWLRDASAFNVQFDGRGLRFIDTLSIGKRSPKSSMGGIQAILFTFPCTTHHGRLSRYPDVITLAKFY